MAVPLQTFPFFESLAMFSRDLFWICYWQKFRIWWTPKRWNFAVSQGVFYKETFYFMTASFFVFGWKMSLKNEFILVKNKISKRRGKDIPLFVKYRPLHNKSLLWNTSHKDTTCEHVWLDANIDKEGTAAAALAGELPCMKTLPLRTCGIPRICQGGGGCCCCCSSSCSSKTAMGTSCELPGMRTLPLSKSDWIPRICQGGGCCCCYSSCCNKLPWAPGVNYLAWERHLWACVAACQGSAREVAAAAAALAAMGTWCELPCMRTPTVSMCGSIPRICPGGDCCCSNSCFNKAAMGTGDVGKAGIKPGGSPLTTVLHKTKLIMLDACLYILAIQKINVLGSKCSSEK